MKTVFLLLNQKLISIRNSLTIQAVLKRIPFILIGLVFWAVFYIGTIKVLDFLRGILFFGEILSKKLLSMTFFSLGIFLVLSNIITALSSFYLSKDIPFLVSKPIRTKDILGAKTVETISISSWMVISFIPPFFIAYRESYNAPLLFYSILFFTFIFYLLIAGGIGISLAHILTRIFPARKARLGILALGLFLFVFVYIIARSPWSQGPESPERFVHSLLSIKTESPYLPSYWITESVMPLLTHKPFSILYPLLLVFFGLFMFTLSGSLGNILFINNIERIQPSARRSGKLSSRGWYPAINRAVLWKDVKILFRDAGQWSQLFIISALILVYIYNFRSLPIHALTGIFPFIRELMVLINMVMAGLVLTAVSARFLFSAISLEGTAFWILKSSPVSVEKVLWSKFIYGFIPITITLMSVVIVANIAMEADILLMFLSSFTVLLLCISISGLGIGMGALYPKFKHENVASIAMSPGGMVFMLIAFAVIIITVSLEAWAFYHYKISEMSRMPIEFKKKVAFFLLGSSVIIINLLTFYVPMKLGKKKLGEDLIL